MDLCYRKYAKMLEFIKQPWPWYVAGPSLTVVMFFLLYFGKSFGVSRNLQTICSVAGADKLADYFRIDTKARRWGLVFVLGSIAGGFLSANFLTESSSIALASDTIARLQELGFQNAGDSYLPAEIFGSAQVTSLSGLTILLLGGMLVGFGARYAGGCTSGHAISGLSNLQIPSLIAVVGFFIGGLIMTHALFPVLF